MSGYITSEQWQDFVNRFPSACAYLRHLSLVSELRHLRNQVIRGLANDWQKNRLQELETWNTDTQAGV